MGAHYVAFSAWYHPSTQTQQAAQIQKLAFHFLLNCQPKHFRHGFHSACSCPGFAPGSEIWTAVDSIQHACPSFRNIFRRRCEKLRPKNCST